VDLDQTPYGDPVMGGSGFCSLGHPGRAQTTMGERHAHLPGMLVRQHPGRAEDGVGVVSGLLAGVVVGLPWVVVGLPWGVVRLS
jgi:hypothetical protein